MTVIRPNSISGVTSITGQSGDISIFRADGTAADLNVNNITSGIITATHYGSGANLTSLPAGQLTGTVADARLTTVSSSKLSGALPALDGSALTGVGHSFGNSSVNTTGIITATAFISSQGTLANRNKIINGDFTVHQRGGTIASSSGNYTLDRWRTYRSGSSSGGFSVEQSTGSYPQTNISGVIDNFKASAFITVTSAGSADTNNNCKFQQRIEGSNVYDLAFGTIAAKKVTVSFYVKCSLTGDFGIALVNGAHNRSNVQLYTVNSASTWERKILTFVGDTSGTWVTNTGTGLQLMFDMGSGSDKHTSSLNTWVSGEKHGTSSSVKLIHTNGATIQYAGVQLEAGEIATPFEHHSYADELRRCGRYYQRISGNNGTAIAMAFNYNTTLVDWVAQYPMGPMRAIPSLDQVNGSDYFQYQGGGQSVNHLDGAFVIEQGTTTQANIYFDPDNNLTAGGIGYILTDNGSAYLAFSSEL